MLNHTQSPLRSNGLSAPPQAPYGSHIARPRLYFHTQHLSISLVTICTTCRNSKTLCTLPRQWNKVLGMAPPINSKHYRNDTDPRGYVMQLECVFVELKLSLVYLATKTRIHKSAGGKFPHILNCQSRGKNIVEIAIKMWDVCDPLWVRKVWGRQNRMYGGTGRPLAVLQVDECQQRDAQWQLPYGKSVRESIAGKCASEFW